MEWDKSVHAEWLKEWLTELTVPKVGTGQKAQEEMPEIQAK